MDAEYRLLVILTNSKYKTIINDIKERAQYFVSERDLSFILLTKW